MRQTTALILLLLIVITAACAGAEIIRPDAASINNYQDIPGVTGEEITAIERLKAEKGRLSFGSLPKTEEFLLSDGTYLGFMSDFSRLLTGLFGIEFAQVPYYSWRQLKNDVDSCNIDFTGDLTPTAVRRLQYYMTETIADNTQKLVTLTDSDIEVEQDVNGLRLGFLKDSVNMNPIKRRYPEVSFEVVYVDYISSIEGMLVSGEIDAFVTDRNLDPFFDGNELIRIMDFFPLAFTPIALSTANRELAPFISVIDKYLDAGGVDILNDMYKDAEFGYTKRKLMKSFTEEERAYLNDLWVRGAMVNIALENDDYPFSFYNEADKEFQGMAVDVINEISRLTDISFKNIATPESKWTELLDALYTGEASVVSQLGYTKQREEQYIWSERPYSVNNNYILISKIDAPKVESYQIPNMRVGVTDGKIYEDVYKKWFSAGRNLIRFPTTDDTLDALERDEIDLVMGAENVLLAQINYREKTGYIANYRFSSSMEAMLGFNKDEENLRSIMSKAQQLVDVASIESYWKGRVFDYSKTIARMQNIYTSIFASGLVLVVITLIPMLRKNERLEKNLLKNISTLQTIYASIPDLIFSKDADGVFTSCNPSFEKYAGISEEELIGKTDAEVFELHDPEAAARYQEADRRVLESNSPEFMEEIITYPDSTRRLLETITTPLLQNGKTVGVLGIGRDVTERQEAKSRLARIINTAQIAFILTVDGVVEEANEYSKQNIGVKIGEDMLKYYSRPEQRDEVIKAADEQGLASNVVIWLNMASGESRRFLGNITHAEYEQRKAYIIWAIDIEMDERRNDQLRVAQQSFQTVIDALPVPVRIVDMETATIAYVNDNLLELLEYDTADELIGRGIIDLLPAVLSDGTEASERLDVVMEAVRPSAFEIEYIKKGGDIIEALVVTRQIDYRGRPSSIGIIKDLTAEKERERILTEAAEREKDANQAKSLFLANMSHEIRTPMNGVIGMTELLLGEQLPGRQLQYVKDIKTSAESLLGIINDILDLSKITEGRLQITPVDIDLSNLLENTASMMSFSANSKGLEFINDVKIRTPEYVCVDDVRLKQVIVNLLSNAIKFTQAGYVKFSARIEEGNIVIVVSDTGPGIKQDEIPLIFLAFEQADKRKNRTIKGTGLGLSISKNLVELMGGRIWVESEYGKGSAFFMTLPYVEGDEAAVEAADAVFEYISAPTAQALLVDDIQTNLTVGAGLLYNCKITADVALSGDEAIELVTAKDYDIIFMDHMMPGMDGIEATGIIRGMGGKYDELPIIALTANAVNESRSLLLSSGMNDFLSKPIDKQALMGILKKWLPPEKIVISKEHDKGEAAEPYSEALKAASMIDGLDIDLALSRIGGMQDVLEASLRQLTYTITERLKKMDRELSDNELRGFGIDAHGFKGELANIGATRNSELAGALEIAAKADNLPQCLDRFSTFASAMESFASDLKAVFPKPRREKIEMPSGNHALLKVKANEAIDCMGAFEAAEALKCLSELEGFTFGKDIDEMLDDAISSIRSFRYEIAEEILRNISNG